MCCWGMCDRLSSIPHNGDLIVCIIWTEQEDTGFIFGGLNGGDFLPLEGVAQHKSVQCRFIARRSENVSWNDTIVHTSFSNGGALSHIWDFRRKRVSLEGGGAGGVSCVSCDNS
jgi:hypothetical protein